MFELEEGKLNEISQGNIDVQLPLENMYIRKINEQFTLVINSFRNKVYVVENKYINEHYILVSKNLEENFYTPFSNPTYFTDDKLYEEKKENNSKIYISLAITYSCNLRCSYCFQQNHNGLLRKPVTLENLKIIFDKILKIKDDYPESDIYLGLFGGEPLLPKNEDTIDKIFEFCVKNKIKIDITTNGIFLPYFAKKIIIHRSIISVIAITINSLPENYNKIVKVTKVANNVEKLLNVTNLLLDYGLTIDVGTNFDKTNIGDFISIYNYFHDEGYFKKHNFFWNIGRVDDRFYDTGYDDYIISETDLLLELIKIRNNFPRNIHAGFIQTAKNMTDKLKLTFNENQLKGRYNYCWNVSPYDRVYYVDNELNLFRCTVTVGRPEYIIGNLNTFDLMKYKNEVIDFRHYKECINCNIGGFCAGGCKLSADTDFYKQCFFERKEFQKFIEKIMVPEIKNLLSRMDVN